MARFMSQAKKGFYALPPHLVGPITQYLSALFPEESNILDICAGEGEALVRIGEQLGIPKANLFANELDERRAQCCADLGINTVCGDGVNELIAPSKSFSLLYLNPPYDHEVTEDMRTETKFLDAAYRFLMDNGIVIFVVPLAILSELELEFRIPRLFSDIAVFRFPDEDFGKFKQCVVIARKNRGTSKTDREQYASAVESPYTLGDAIEEKWSVPPRKLVKGKFSFFSKHLTASLAEELVSTPVAQKSFSIGLSRPTKQSLQSLMPLRAGHLAMTLASGLMDGAYKDPESGNILVISGTTEIRERRTDSIDEEGVEETRILKTPEAKVVAFDVTASREADIPKLYVME